MSSSERVLRETALPSRGDVSPGTGTAESPNRESATSRALGLSGNGSGRGDVEGAASTPDGLAGSLAIRAGELVKRSVVGSLVKNCAWLNLLHRSRCVLPVLLAHTEWFVVLSLQGNGAILSCEKIGLTTIAVRVMLMPGNC